MRYGEIICSCVFEEKDLRLQCGQHALTLVEEWCGESSCVDVRCGVAGGIPPSKVTQNYRIECGGERVGDVRLAGDPLYDTPLRIGGVEFGIRSVCSLIEAKCEGRIIPFECDDNF